ncbi:hypothetical protein [Roseinatronobacter alkalisoli]|uniref:Uncharacterized protein n=1 Tax=Roseinatronobacter alkalisoli TaxID=3028235 RepID=A0ABT5T6T1_9RHOB|nr:hypothetical protein [Roseinatronobacter sp. HJB301]MDD7969932.1 hypothetical protein [Roseinatronobacter sp. HJB301]
MWRRKLTVIAGETREGDYIILRDRQVVGRIYPAHLIPDASPYVWATYTYPATEGRADSLDDAAEAVRAHIRTRWLDSVPAVPLAADRKR